MTVQITFGGGIGIAAGGSIGLGVLIGICIALWRCCCGDNNFWRGVNWCKGTSQEGSESPETVKQSMLNIHCLSCHCCGGSSNVNNIQSRGSVQFVNETPEETVSSQQQSNVNSQPASNPSGSNQTVHPTAPPERSNENDPLLPPPNVDNQPANNPSGSNQTVHPTAPPERSNENDPLLPPPSNVGTGSSQSVSLVTVDVHQRSAAQSDTSDLTTESSSTAATSDQPDSRTNQTTSHQPQQQLTGNVGTGSSHSGSLVTVDVHQRSAAQSDTSDLTTESSSTAATSDQPDSQTNQTTSHQPQQRFTAVERVPSSMVPTSTGGCFASQPTNKRKFSAKFVGDLGNVLDPDSAVDADWRLMLIELGQSQGEIRKVHSMRHPTEEALYSWQEAGRSLDELLEIYQEKRPDVTEVIERYKKNNACYAIPVETVQQTPRHETAIVTTEQLIKLAHNLGPWNELAINLGMSGGDIYKIKEDNKYDQWAQVFYMLEKWQKRESPKATVGLLYKKCCETKTIDKEFYAFLLK
ncbi:uncharacterized protein LOC117292302 isoform X2 [Asterias rubens]|uniref:uncharacterized protein LOC117292302 isoform X2 n=1 Tax=Asterias rubens TaxID=7604 RepID=UPI0014559564|nr:uncharacterized protein LOC117292302 isoform X2 [Asterias rubens]